MVPCHPPGCVAVSQSYDLSGPQLHHLILSNAQPRQSMPLGWGAKAKRKDRHPGIPVIDSGRVSQLWEGTRPGTGGLGAGRKGPQLAHLEESDGLGCLLPLF